MLDREYDELAEILGDIIQLSDAEILAIGETDYVDTDDTDDTDGELTGELNW